MTPANRLVVLLCFLLSINVSSAASTSVIVIGAGMSGLSAAKEMHDSGMKNFLILEATNRIGGRVHKTKFSGYQVELGANWIEGVGGPKRNPILEISAKIGLRAFRSNYDNLESNTYQESGGLYDIKTSKQAFRLADKIHNYSINLANALSANNEDDISILTAQRLFGHVPSNALDMVADYYNYDFEMATPPRSTSLIHTLSMPTTSNFGSDTLFVADPRGYESVVYHVARQFLSSTKDGVITDQRLKLNKVVREIIYTKSGVTVRTEDGSTYKADYVMVSVSIGVLQTRLIRFRPALPHLKKISMHKYDMAIYTKIFLKFPYKFWPSGKSTEFFLYASAKRGYYPFWQHLDAELPGSNILFVTVTDDESRRIEQQSDELTKTEAMEVLRSMFGVNIPNATDILVPRWWSDRFFKGSYSNWPIGVTEKEFDRIKAPVGRVYFTGEHTSKDYNGFLHGAYLEGIDSAKKLLSCIKLGSCHG